MASKKYFVDIDLQSNKVDNLKSDTLDITDTINNPASANTKRIVYWNGDYYYSDGTNWILMSNVVPSGGTSGQVLAKATNSNYDLEWVNQTGGGGSGIPFAIASGTDTYTATVTGVTAYNDGDAYLIRFTNGNTTSCTLNINSLGAIPLYENNDGALIGGDIVSDGQMLCVYNSTLTCFQTIGTAPNTLVSYITNVDTVTLTKGMPVYAYGGTGDRMTVKRASNLGDPTSAQTVGLVLSTSIAVNQKGFIMMQGLLENLSILPTSTFADGDAIYLGATAGTITNVKPYAPNHLVYLGTITTASNGNSGRLYVRVQNGYELQELHNVQAQSPSNDDTLYYDGLDSQWKTASIPTILGYTPENVANKSTDVNLGTSNTLYPTQNAVKTYTDNILGNANALVYKGVIDCSTNPNYPAADAGFMYIVSVAGKIGGASGIDVEVGDMLICNTDGTVSGNQATVGQYWNIIQKNIIGAVTGPASSVNNNVAFFDGTTGKVIKDNGITLSGNNTGDVTVLDGTTIDFTLTGQQITGEVKDSSITEAKQLLSDVTTYNVSTSRHGYAPKLPNDATKYLDGTGNYSTPSSGGGTDILQVQVFS